MIAGIAAAIVAGALWGLVFIAPHYTASFSALELTVVRYGFFGIASLGILLGCGLGRIKSVSRRDWFRFFLYGLTGYAAYYTFCATAIQLIGTAFTALIIGSLPLVMAVIGNILTPAVPFRRLAPPLVLVAAGLALIHAEAIGISMVTAGAARDAWIGIAAAFAAVAVWTYYGLSNASQIMRQPATMSSAVWTALIGVGTLAALVPVSVGAVAINGWPAMRPRAEVINFLVWAAALGIICSWGATYLWNIASRRLPTPLLAQLIVFETLFALAYGYWHENRPPTPLEAASALLILWGVIWGVRVFTGRVASPAA